MKRLQQGSIIRIPLLKDMGYAYAKYIDLMKLDKGVTLAEVIKIFDIRTDVEVEDLELLNNTGYLLSPIAVAGLRPTLKQGLWKNIGNIPLDERDGEIPDFKGGNSTWEEIAQGDWFLYRKASLSSKQKTSYETVKYLQPFAAMGTGLIEIRLTMYFILREGKRVSDFFDLKDERFKSCYQYIQDSPALPDVV